MLKLRMLDQFIAVYDNALSDFYCDDLIGKEKASFGATFKAIQPGVTDYMQRHRTMLTEAGAPQLRDPKTGTTIQVNLETWDQLDKALDGKLASHLSAMIFCFGGWSIDRLVEQTPWKSGVFPEPGSTDALHRVLSVTVFLDEIGGGDLEFLQQEITVKPKKGTLVLAPAAWTHTRRFQAPDRELHVLSGWLKFQPADVLYGDGVVV